MLVQNPICYTAEMEKKTGGCHCGKVRYEVEIDLTQPVIECNCSHCAVKGLLLAFVPASAFTLTSGQESITEYRFNIKLIAHEFCKVCGVQPFGHGEGPNGPTAAINVRTLDSVDLESITRTPYNGKDI
jgi:hypothetical protein